MRKLILISIVIVLSFFSVCFAGSIQDAHKAVIARMNVGGGGDTGDDVLLWWRCETTTVDYSIGDTIAALTGEAQLAAGGKTNNGIQILDGSNNGADFYTLSFLSNNDLINPSANGTVYFWFKLSVRTDYGRLFAATEDSNNLIIVRVRNTDELEFVWVEGGAETSMITTNLNFSLNTGYLLQLHFNNTANTRSIHIYNESTGAEIGTGAASAAAYAGFTVTSGGVGITMGQNDAPENMEGFMDDIRTSNSDTRDFVALRGTDAYPF